MRERIARGRLDEARALLLLEGALEAAAQRGRLRSFLKGVVPRRYWSDIAQRLRIAQLLIGGYSYRGIEDETRASARTIALVDRWLQEENPSYRRVTPKRHKRLYRENRDFTDAALPWPGSVRGHMAQLFGVDPRQR